MPSKPLKWLPWLREGRPATRAIDRNPSGDTFCIDLEPDDDGYFYLHINDGECREGDWRQSVEELKVLANTYAKGKSGA